MKKDDCLLLDIGEDCVKVAFAEKQKVSALELFSIFGYENEQRKNLEIAKVLRKYLSANKITAKKAHLSISCSEVFVWNVRLSIDGDIDRQIQSFIQNNLFFNLKDIYYGYQVIDNVALIAAVPRPRVEKLLAVLADIGLSAEKIVPAALCVASYVRVLGAPISETAMFMDIGHSHTDLLIIRSGAVRFFRAINFGSGDLVAELQEFYRVTPEEAQKMLKTLDLSGSIRGKTFRLGIRNPVSIIEPILDSFVTDVKRTIGYYLNEEDGDLVSKVFIHGGTVRIAGFCEYLGKSIGIPVDKLALSRDKLDLASVLGEKLIKSNNYLHFYNIAGLVCLLSEDTINLISQRKETDKPAFSNVFKGKNFQDYKQLTKWMIAGLIYFMGLAVAYYFVLVVLSGFYTGKVQKQQQDLQILLKKSQNVKDFELNVKKIEEKERFFSKFQQKTTIFSEINLVYPAKVSGIELESISFDKQSNQLSLKGIARNNKSFQDYVKAIQTAQSSREVDVRQVNQLGNASNIRFELALIAAGKKGADDQGN